MPLSRELASTRRSPERHSRRKTSPEARRRDKDHTRRSHSPDAGRRRRQDSGDRDAYRSRNRSFTEKFRERDGDNHRHHSPEHGERRWRRNSDREKGGSPGRSERRRSRSRSPMRVGSVTRDRSSDASRSGVRSSRRDDTRRSVDSLISRGPGMRSDRMYPPENEITSPRERLNRGRPRLDRETTMQADLHVMRGRGLSYRRGSGRFGARRGAYYGRTSPMMISDDPTDVPKGGFYFEHDDRAASEGGGGYYRRGGGGGRFRGRGRWNRFSYSPMRWEHDRFRSKSPSPVNGEGEGMVDREGEAGEEEEESDEEFLRSKVTLRSRVTYEAPSSKWDTDHTEMEH